MIATTHRLIVGIDTPYLSEHKNVAINDSKQTIPLSDSGFLLIVNISFLFFIQLAECLQDVWKICGKAAVNVRIVLANTFLVCLYDGAVCELSAVLREDRVEQVQLQESTTVAGPAEHQIMQDIFFPVGHGVESVHELHVALGVGVAVGVQVVGCAAESGCDVVQHLCRDLGGTALPG